MSKQREAWVVTYLGDLVGVASTGDRAQGLVERDELSRPERGVAGYRIIMATMDDGPRCPCRGSVRCCGRLDR